MYYYVKNCKLAPFLNPQETQVILKILPIFLLALFVVGCSSSNKKTKAEEQKITKTEVQADVIKAQAFNAKAGTAGLVLKKGRLSYTGNEPFVQPAIFVSGTEAYKLKADSTFIKETFKTLNGKQVSLYGTIDSSGTGTYLNVYYYQIRD